MDINIKHSIALTPTPAAPSCRHPSHSESISTRYLFTTLALLKHEESCKNCAFHPGLPLNKSIPITDRPPHRLRIRRRELALLPDPRPVLVENHRNGHEQYRNTAKERAGPVDAHGVVHVNGEEREDGASEGAEEGIGCDGGGGARLGLVGIYDGSGSGGGRARWHLQHEVSVDNVIEGLKEYG